MKLSLLSYQVDLSFAMLAYLCTPARGTVDLTGCRTIRPCNPKFILNAQFFLRISEVLYDSWI